MLCSISDGFAREGLLGAILLRACCDAMLSVGCRRAGKVRR
jgi:hypothetical protein